VVDTLHSKYLERYPHITFEHPKRLYDAEMFKMVPNLFHGHILGIPDNDFHHDVRYYLKSCPRTCDYTIVSIWTFYIAIDKNMRDHDFQLFYNAYVKRIATSKYQKEEVVQYVSKCFNLKNVPN
jgi:hypothetical protein